VGDVIGFDVYGTLVDPLAMREPLAAAVGAELADHAASLWRTTQIDYTFRRASMRAYEDFSVCTRQALTYTLKCLRVTFTAKDEEFLLDHYLRLPAYPDVSAGLESLRSTGARLIAFSNGTERAVRTVLENAALLEWFDEIVSVDDLRTYKPDPAVYHYLARRGGQPAGRTWLVSSNGWDVIGARSAGLRAVWLKRGDGAIFDPWGIEPTLTVSSLSELPSHFAA
jgi:2-haloacid dehalogenase